MKNLVLSIAILVCFTSCGQHGHEHNSLKSETSSNTLEKSSDFPTVGLKKEYEQTINFPIEKVFPLFEPQGRTLLYENWNPIVLREGKDGSLKDYLAFSKYDDLDVFLRVTKYNPENGHVQYFVTWDDFEIQRIDIYCKQGEKENTTKIKWVEYNAGLYEKGEKLVSMFVNEGYLVKVVQRYINNVEKKLKNDN